MREKYTIYKYEVLSFIVPFTILLFAYFIYTYILGLHLVGNSENFYQQQISLIEYIRSSFYMTHDLFPQLNMRHGGFSSYANLVLYGSMNPIVWLSFLFPMISIQTYIELLIIFYISVISFLNYKVIHFETRNKNLSLLVGYAFAVAPVVICHMQYQLQYIWFYPFFLICMWAIQKFDKRFVVFGLAFSTIFYFNFFLALSCYVFLLLYFLYLIWGRALVKFSAKDYTIYFLVISLIALMIGFLPMLIQLNAVNLSDYTAFSGFININFIGDIFVNNDQVFGYQWQMYLYTVFAFLSVIFIERTRAFIYMIFLVLATLIIPLNQILNMFLPYDTKIFIYFIPILMVVFAKTMLLLREYQLLEKTKILVGANLFILILVFFNSENIGWQDTISFLLIQNLVIIVAFFDLKRIIYVAVGIVVITSSFVLYAPFGTGEYAMPAQCASTNKLERDLSMDDYNTTNCQNSYVMSQATAITNPYLLEYSKNNLNNDSDDGSIDNKLLFRSPIIYEVMSIGAERSLDVEPFIVGVEEQYIYGNDLATFTNLDMLTHVEAQGYENLYVDQPDHEIKDETTHELEGGDTLTYDVAQYCNSYFSATVVVEGDSDIYVNDQLLTYENAVILEDGTRVNHYVMACGPLNEITVSAVEDEVIESVELEFYDLTKMMANEIDVNEPTNVMVDYNNGLTFNLEMKTEGMMVSTIPYDDNFIVKVDGEEVDTEVVNNYFLGAKVPKGNHKIEVSYKMQGFTVGLIVSSIGLICLLILAYIQYNNKKVNQ